MMMMMMVVVVVVVVVMVVMMMVVVVVLLEGYVSSEWPAVKDSVCEVVAGLLALL